MDIKTLKELLSENDIMRLLQHLGANPKKVNGYITAKTICHCGNKHKLIYYDNKKIFTCLTDCNASFDVIGLIERVKYLEFYPSLMWLCDFFGIGKNFTATERVEGHEFLEVFAKKEEEKPQLRVIDESILNEIYYPIYHQSWIDEHITISTMKKFGIRFSIVDDCIIIPHKDEKGKLVGIRCRNFDERLLDDGRKYMPVYAKGKLMNHPTNAILYGLWENLENIKKYKTVVIFEAEKSVLQMSSFKDFPSVGVAVCGSKISEFQISLLKELGVENVILAFDKEFEENDSIDELYQMEKMKNFVLKMRIFFNVSIIHDRSGYIGLKDSPSDKGEKIFMKLYEERIII